MICWQLDRLKCYLCLLETCFSDREACLIQVAEYTRILSMQHAQQVAAICQWPLTRSGQIAARCHAFDFCALILHSWPALRGRECSAGTQMARFVYDRPQQHVLTCKSNINHCLLQKQGCAQWAGQSSGAVTIVECSGCCRCWKKLVCWSHQQAQESHHHLARWEQVSQCLWKPTGSFCQNKPTDNVGQVSFLFSWLTFQNYGSSQKQGIQNSYLIG